MFTKISAVEKAPEPTASRNEYATHRTFCQVFIQEMNHLYLLAFLLTADHQSAEQCFVESVEDCMSGRPVFREWAERWIRRMIMINAIRIVSPASMPEKTVFEADSLQSAMRLDLSQPLEAITRLAPFERFALILSIFEGYTVQECSILLNGARADVIRARTRALQKLAGGNSSGTRFAQVFQQQEGKKETINA